MEERTEPICSQHLENSRLSREQGHEFKNIFSIIIANAEMVGEELGATGLVQRRLERIVEACRRGEGLVERIRNPEIREPTKEADCSQAAFSSTMPAGRVLVVDDEADVVAIISRYLIKEGLCVRGVTDSGQALNLLRADPFCCDLVITDMDMPALTGAALSRELQEMRPDLPVIMITGHDRHVSGTATADLGIREVLLKPLNRQTLLTAVRRLLVS